MPPKKQKQKPEKPGGADIRSFFKETCGSPGCSTGSPQPGVATQTAPSTPRKLKEEDDSSAGHSHNFIVKFKPRARYEYTIHCNQPCTVLEAIKSNEKSKEFLKGKDENIIIQLGTGDKECIVATHFPCTCVNDGETLIISCKDEKIEEVKPQLYMVYPKDRYSVFYIDKEGGINAKTKMLFRSHMVKQFKSLCVYGELGTTVEEALKRDGRFSDALENFSLSDNERPTRRTVRSQTVDTLHQKTLKICLPLGKRSMDGKTQPNGSESSVVSQVARQRGVSAEAERKRRDPDINLEEIYELLCEQCPGLKDWMKQRFPGESFQEELNLKKENFGKIQQAFSEVHRLKKLFKLGESVCKIHVTNVCVGTGFVLFDRFILTNAHLFSGYVEDKKLEDGIEVFALFNYDNPDPHNDYHCFTAEETFVDIDFELDYAVLELNPEEIKSDQQDQRKNKKIPPGLLKNFGPMPKNGEACIIGHPAGDVKKVDPTWIIEKDRRGQAVEDHLKPYENTLFIVQSIRYTLKNQGIENILEGGRKADEVGTYHTFMYHGASGSPVFDAHGKVFGLHTAGFVYGFPSKTSVIEFARDLLTIIKKFVENLKENRNDEMLKKMREAAEGNRRLQEILNPESAETEEDMDVDE